jgi:lipoprotein-releasing system ATP-binding protein
MTASDAALVTRGLTKRYSSPGGDLSILEGVDLSLERGSALAIVGPSGAGKSTLLYLLGALDSPTTGTMTLLGDDPHAMNPTQQAAFRNRHVGFVFQDHHLLPQCTVMENVLIPTLAGDGATMEAEQRAHQLLDRVGLSARLDHLPAKLSGGERQRVAVCRALIHRPTLLLADEPTGNLDRVSADAVGSLLLELHAEQNTILICVTHSQELANRFPRRLELRDGHLRDV